MIYYLIELLVLGFNMLNFYRHEFMYINMYRVYHYELTN